MNQYISNDTARILIATVYFIGILVMVFFIYRKLFRLLKKRTVRTTRKSDNFILELSSPEIGLQKS